MGCRFTHWALLGLCLTACSRGTPSSSTPLPPDTSVHTGKSDTGQPHSTADTGPIVPTADTAPFVPADCTPRQPAVPGEIPLVVVQPMSDFSPAAVGSEWQSQGGDVFIAGEIVGFSWDADAPWASTGVMWYHHSELPVPTGPGRTVIGASVYAPGDVTQDGIADLSIGVDGSEFPDEQFRHFYLPGPLANYSDPVLEHPGIIEFIPQALNGIPYAPAGRAIECGDIDGDGFDDSCGHAAVDFSPVDSVPDWTLEDFAGVIHGMAGDLDGNGTDELYLAYVDHIDRYEYTTGVPSSPPTATWTGPGTQQAFIADLDGDGIDGIITTDSYPGNLVEITDADFHANTSTSLGIEALWGDAIVGDFDGDGALELASAYPAGTHVLIEELDGTEKLRIEFDAELVANFGHEMDAGDVDGNGIDDLVIGAPASETGQVFFLFDPLCEREP